MRVSPRLFVSDESQDALKTYLREIGHAPLLSATEEQQLARLVQTGQAEQEKPPAERNVQVIETSEQARCRFLEANLRLVISEVRDFIAQTHTPLSFLDLVQEGNLGLMHALEKFDPERGHRFSTYATWWIRQALGRAQHRQSHLIQLPYHVCGQLARVKRTHRYLAEHQTEEPTAQEIANVLDLPVATVADLLSWDYRVVSLEKPFEGTENQSFGSLLDEREPLDMLVGISQKMQADLLHAMITQAGLSARERQVLDLRYGLSGPEYSLAEVANILSPPVSRERVRQIEKNALQKLQACREQFRAAHDAVVA